MSGGSYFTRSKARALISNTNMEVVGEVSTTEGQVLREDVDNDTSTTMSLEVSDLRDVDQFHELSEELAETMSSGQPQGVETEPTTTPVVTCVQTEPPTTNLTPVTSLPDVMSAIQQLIIGMSEMRGVLAASQAEIRGDFAAAQETMKSEILSHMSSLTDTIRKDIHVEITNTRTDLEGQIAFVNQHYSQEIEAVKKDSLVSLERVSQALETTQHSVAKQLDQHTVLLEEGLRNFSIEAGTVNARQDESLLAVMAKNQELTLVQEVLGQKLDDSTRVVASVRDPRVDGFSKICQLYCLKRATAETCIARVEKYITRVGKPAQILSDHGSQFTSHKWYRRLEGLGIQATHSSVRHPASNPCERGMKEIGRFMRCYCHQKHTTWPTYVPISEGLLNTLVHSSTQFSPYEVHYGIRPGTFLDKHFQDPRVDGEKPKEDDPAIVLPTLTRTTRHRLEQAAKTSQCVNPTDQSS